MSHGIVVIEGMEQSVWMGDGGTQVRKGEKRKCVCILAVGVIMTVSENWRLLTQAKVDNY
jgi:hypothetical protein